MVEFINSGFIFFVMFVVGGYAFLISALLVIGYFKRIGYGGNDSSN